MLKKMIHDARFELPELNINIEGDVLVFDKPYQCTSFDLVEKVKKYIRRKYQQKVKVGHAGTLDPLATGVMIICVGSFTKKIEQYQAQEKEYTGTFMLGATTPSFDLEKPVNEIFPIEHITEKQIYDVAKSFIGTQEQIPPNFSAVKVDGKRAYLLAREGKVPEIKPKTITISEFEITQIALPEVDFRIVCSKGTYIRSLARDFGQRLNSGTHLTALRRTRIGEFTVEEAVSVTRRGE
ncbi:MAG: tRNA pseudouridine(55) synthase TruB [Bacteroidetes bacterium]|nr:tRNA pseudouridine(55) synthase TruB [Bacteroidota bacterium]MCL1969368.1 tRNA pseudouridine(55) synthase TruB [Bacteroidota bacterium]